MQLIRQAMNKQLLPFESENGNYEGEATQVLVLLSNYYADKKKRLYNKVEAVK